MSLPTLLAALPGLDDPDLAALGAAVARAKRARRADQRNRALHGLLDGRPPPDDDRGWKLLVARLDLLHPGLADAQPFRGDRDLAPVGSIPTIQARSARVSYLAWLARQPRMAVAVPTNPPIPAAAVVSLDGMPVPLMVSWMV